MLRTEKEIEKLRETQRSNMSSYGIGGPYRRYEKAIARRQEHLSELEALNKAQGNSVILETLRMYGYCCPSCQEKIYLTSRSPETVECPLCMRRIYIDGVYTEWKVQKIAAIRACIIRRCAMGVYKNLDMWSIMDDLDRMTEYDYNGNVNDSPYRDYYEEQIRELSILAADMWNELQELKSNLWYKLPDKKIEFCDEDSCTQTAIAWFNTAACMLSDTDMTTLLERENIYVADEFAEKQKRIRALNRLTKEQQMYLYTKVIGFITRYLELSAAFETITALIHELDYHQSFVIRDDSTTAPQAAYL